MCEQKDRLDRVQGQLKDLGYLDAKFFFERNGGNKSLSDVAGEAADALESMLATSKDFTPLGDSVRK